VAGQVVRAIPGAGTRVPVWLLGSSTFSAQLAAQLGLPFAFAAHFAPRQLRDAIRIYRDGFQPSQWHDRPYAMACIPVVAADTDQEAARLATSLQLRFLGIVRGTKDSFIGPPVASMNGRWTAEERFHTETMLDEAIVGGPATVLQKFSDFLARIEVDELMISCNVYDHAAQLRSYEIAAEAMQAKELAA
jgi:luciferase family oxidoreductase group 1